MFLPFECPWFVSSPLSVLAGDWVTLLVPGPLDIFWPFFNLPCKVGLPLLRIQFPVLSISLTLLTFLVFCLRWNAIPQFLTPAPGVDGHALSLLVWNGDLLSNLAM